MSRSDSISRDDLTRLLDVLGRDMRIAGPVKEGRTVDYGISSPDGLLMDDSVSYKSPKEFYFPQAERLMAFGGGTAEEEPASEPFLIFGVRPCDLEGLRILREIFLSGGYSDPFFRRRMENNFIIGLGCVERKEGCFCDKLGIDMRFSDFCDIMLEPDGESYHVEHLSGRGRAALAAVPQTAGVSCGVGRAATAPPPALYLDENADEQRLFGVIDWEEAAFPCRGCGICTFICPTCHCFEFKDSGRDGVISRYRCWDSCMYPRFTLHASGHNPRSARHERYRQRVLHKYLYVRKNTGYTACVGCGRCVRHCPAGMNIKDVAESVMEASR
ncbi:MAG: 4Fe-4S dicluster domain-containing protein [Synergistaceae bacterium]|nr:4Fe-4S dicluster domain-containing protein [Synergistaceae bacterium]